MDTTNDINVLDGIRQEVDEGNAVLSEEARLFIACDDEESYALASTFLLKVKGQIKAIDDKLNPLIEDAHKVHKGLTSLRAELKARPLADEETVKRGMQGYLRAEEKKRLELEATLRAQAFRKAEDERLAKAAELEAAGKTEAAQALIEKPVYAPPVAVRSEAPKMKGVTPRKVWKFEITNPMEIPREFLMVDESKIRRHVAAHQGLTNIDGVKVFEDFEISGRAQ